MPALPPISAAATSVSAEARLAYVRRQLARAYPGAPVALVGPVGSGRPVQVAVLDDGFFAGTAPCPPAPGWREWAGRQLPFFFDAPEAPLLQITGNQVVIGADIVSAAFFLLSGWQEYFSEARDQHGRFPYAASVQARYNFVAVPVVNYYFEILKTALEHATGQQYPPRRWGPQGAPLAAFVSHDVDNLRSAWKAPAKAALRQGRLLDFGRQLARHLTRPDAWDNLEAVAAQVAQYGGRSTFFMLPEHRKAANGTPNADYRLTRQLHERLRKLEGQGCELSLHISIGQQRIYAKELLPKLGFNPIGCRFHYLHWEPRLTQFLLAGSLVGGDQLIYDSTLGFAEHYGFRHGYCLPFEPFDFFSGSETDFLEIPLNVMDTTLHHPRYLQLAPAEQLPALGPMLADIRRFGGVASLLWHNENFDPANERNGPREFHALMRHLQDLGAAFLTGEQVWEEVADEPAVSSRRSERSERW